MTVRYEFTDGKSLHSGSGASERCGEKILGQMVRVRYLAEAPETNSLDLGSKSLVSALTGIAIAVIVFPLMIAFAVRRLVAKGRG